MSNNNNTDKKINLITAPKDINFTTNSDLKGKVDHFNGVNIDSSLLPDDPDEFACLLEFSINVWREENRKGIWLKIPIEKSKLIPKAIEQEFIFHHAKKDYVMLTLWLPESESPLPNYCHTYIGVGGFVVKSETLDDGTVKNYCLVVKEKNGPVTSIWKIPGGRVDPGEDVVEGAVREVFEETGIKTTAISILGFRQHHKALFGDSDMYFVVRLEPTNNDDEIVACPNEIQEAKWMEMNEFIELPYYKGVYKALLELGKESVENKYSGIKFESLPIHFRPGNNTVYHSCETLNSSNL
eukprot:TRINITY_DN7969_c0_g1_i1.p1 TRINITY_DN7969_c0_g1~~TRINITY_DN7969_c0_g1_i1.p1  ORF type:complete len:297 (+),score=91.16 TRINITY_DN7969_c0_g1_i1:95-985(+)